MKCFPDSQGVCYTSGMTASARFQVREDSSGYVVFDTVRNRVWSKTYVRKGWAIREAVRLKDAYQHFKYSNWGA